MVVHQSTAAALKVVLRSGFARRLGARAAGRVYVTPRAERIMNRKVS